jgi:hypothetical protein
VTIRATTGPAAIEPITSIAGAPKHEAAGARSWRSAQNLAPRRSAAASRAAAQAACIADTARAAALDLLGDTVGSVAIAERRIRSEQR